MINNIDLFASIKVSKPNNSSKIADFQSNSPEGANSFRNSLKEAAGNIHREDNTSIRKELVSKSETKLKSVDKPDSSVGEETGSEVEAKENQLEKIVNKLEELLLNLQELINLQQMGEVPAEKQTVLLEGIKEAFQYLTAFQNKLTKLGAVQLKTEIPEMQTIITEFETLLEGILSELKADDGSADNDNSSNFLKKLQSVIEETLPKLETITNTLIENNNVNPDNNIIDVKNEISRNPNSSELEKTLEIQGRKKNEMMTKEGRLTGENEEKQNDEIRVEAAGAENNTLKKGPSTKAETVEEAVNEEEKAALEGKTEKVTVESKENRKQDTNSGTEKENSKEVHMAASTKQNKPVNEDITAIRLKQTAIEDNTETISNQTDAPKIQTVSRTEIINQIVKKAEIILTDTQSEMRLQLEPENLGKLTLKIAVERGLITAKFTAESYEVKQVIESSFNELKDMLQEKGLEVQNFSVSVGQDNREYNNSNVFQQWKEAVKLNGSSMNKGGYEGYLNTETGAGRVVNPYSVHNGEFDHSA